MIGTKLKKLTIHKYPNVAPGTELTFNDTWNVLLGKNGTGKTTLLKLITMVMKHEFGELKETEFSIEYDLIGTGLEIHVSFRNDRAENLLLPIMVSAISIPPQAEPRAAAWAYRVDVNWGAVGSIGSLSSDPVTTSFTSSEKSNENEPLPLPHQSPFNIDLVLLAFLHTVGSADPESQQWSDPDINRDVLLRQMSPLRKSTTSFPFIIQYFSLGSPIGRFDEALYTYGALCSDRPRVLEEVGLPYASLSVVSSVASDTSAPRTVHGSFYAKAISSYVEQLAPSDLAESILLSHNDLPFLRKAIELFGFGSAEMILRLTRKDKINEEVEVLIYSNFSFLFTLPGGSQITQAALSFGQKRLLAFLYYVACNDNIIIADELVNGMHYDWIEACLKEIGGRQSFLTSQNPLLLDFLPFASLEDVQKSFIQCSHAPRPAGQGRAQFAWHNLSDEDAATFFRAYEAGVQHVSEILKTKGMW